MGCTAGLRLDLRSGVERSSARTLMDCYSRLAISASSTYRQPKSISGPQKCRSACGCGGIGRRSRLKICLRVIGMSVRVRPPVPIQQFLSPSYCAGTQCMCTGSSQGILMVPRRGAAIPPRCKVRAPGSGSGGQIADSAVPSLKPIVAKAKWPFRWI